MNKTGIIYFAIAASLLLFGCAKKTEVLDGSFGRDKEYEASFSTKYVTVGDLTLHMEKTIFDEDTLQKTARLLETDYKKIKKTGNGAQNAVIVYLVDKTLSGKPQASGNKMFCSPEDIQSGEYRLYLTKAGFSLSSLWKSIGLDAYIFGVPTAEKAIADEEMREYYDKADNIETLSLLPVYFLPDFSDTDTIRMARNTSFSLSEYILSNYEISDFLKAEKGIEYRQEWLESIRSVEKAETLKISGDDMELSVTEKFPAVVHYQDYIFNFIPTDWLQNADDIYYFLADFSEGCNEIFTTLEKTEPEIYSLVLERFNEGNVHFYFMNSDVSLSTGGWKIVNLNNKEDAYHELFHAILIGPLEEQRWLDEGVTMMLSLKAESKYRDKERFFDYLMNPENYTELPQDDQIFADYVREYYSQNALWPAEAADLDFALFYEAVGMTAIKNPEIQTSLMMAAVDLNQRKNSRMGYDRPPGEGGMGLTYPEIYVFTKYLSEKYGLYTAVEVLIGEKTFENAYGGGYEKVFSEFLAEILN